MYAYHLSEFDVQCAAIGLGLATQVPLNVLRMFTWSQAELLVSEGGLGGLGEGQGGSQDIRGY